MRRETAIHTAVLERIRAELDSTERARRAEAIEALAAVKDRCGLLRGLRSPDPYVRRCAVSALVEPAGALLSCRIAARRADDDAGVRAAAARVLSARGGAVAGYALARMALCDADAAVRYAALIGLRRRHPWAFRAVARVVAAHDRAEWLRDAAVHPKPQGARRRTRLGG